MPKYTVVAGKHTTRDSSGTNVYHRQGQVVDLPEEEAAKFPDKLKLVAAVEQARPDDTKSDKISPAASGQSKAAATK